METILLQAKPKGLFSSVVVLKQDEKEVATITMKILREAGTLSIGERNYTMEREGMLGGDFLLKNEEETVVVRATRPSAWKDRYVILYGDLEFALARITAWKNGFALLWNGESLGTINRPRWYSRDTDISLPDSLPLEVRAFVFWLVMVQWNRDAAAAT